VIEEEVNLKVDVVHCFFFYCGAVVSHSILFSLSFVQWGEYWGEGGWMKLIRGVDELGVEDGCSFVIPDGWGTKGSKTYVKYDEDDVVEFAAGVVLSQVAEEQGFPLGLFCGEEGAKKTWVQPQGAVEEESVEKRPKIEIDVGNAGQVASGLLIVLGVAVGAVVGVLGERFVAERRSGGYTRIGEEIKV